MYQQKSEVRTTWLQIAKVSRTSGQYQIATNAINRTPSGGLAYAIEKAKLSWVQGQAHEALKGLKEEFVRRKTAELVGTEKSEDDQAINEAKAHLLLGRWMQHTGQDQMDAIIAQFEEVIKLQPE